VNCKPYQILFGWSNEEKFKRRGIFWWGNLKERGHFEDIGVDGRIIL
jgi:hypothetical protein